jgi:hypothetical protein
MKIIGFAFPLFLLSSSLASPTPTCQRNTITTSDLVAGAVSLNTSPALPFQHSALTKVNATAWEYWYFDGVSEDTKSGITIVFFRDPSLASQGLGSLRVSVDAVWKNGTSFQSIILADQSTIETCGEVTTGYWTGKSINSTFAFRGNREARIDISGSSITGDRISGTFVLRSFSNARYPAGQTYPDRKASVFMAPLLYWNEGIPSGSVKTDLTLKGTNLQFQGIGGTDRNIAAYTWDFIADHWWWVRAVAGPFSLVHWKFVSGIDKKTYSYAYLEKDSKPVFTSTKECTNAKEVDCAVFSLTHDGNVKGTFNDSSTGFEIEYRGKGKGKAWTFDIEHTNVVFEAPATSNDEYSRFVNSAKGGRVGKEQCAGQAKSEQNKIRTIFPLL